MNKTLSDLEMKDFRSFDELLIRHVKSILLLINCFNEQKHKSAKNKSNKPKTGGFQIIIDPEEDQRLSFL